MQKLSRIHIAETRLGSFLLAIFIRFVPVERLPISPNSPNEFLFCEFSRNDMLQAEIAKRRVRAVYHANLSNTPGIQLDNNMVSHRSRKLQTIYCLETVANIAHCSI